jgi:hypothetical protein
MWVFFVTDMVYFPYPHKEAKLMTTTTIECIWTDEAGNIVGARINLGAESKRPLDIPLLELQRYAGKLENADVIDNTIKAKPGFILPTLPLSRKTEWEVTTYTLMHGDEAVCVINRGANVIEVLLPDKLPFSLRGLSFDVLDFMRWLDYRLDNLSRTYMNKVYIVRKVGRDRERILRDSCAISLIDNFWVKRSDVNTSWAELCATRDKNVALANTALTGQITEKQYKSAITDTTSLFTVKGAFNKGILDGFILKQGNNAEYEYVAAQLGAAAGINTAAAVMQSDGIVGCRIFTTHNRTMVHARDLLHFTDYVPETDDQHRAIHSYFIGMGRTDIARSLERVYLFHYLTINLDFHEENFGILYDSDNFDFLDAAPGYDFNSAFAEISDPTVYYAWIVEQLPQFVKNHPDIISKLNNGDFRKALESQSYLSETQRDCVMNRVEYLNRLF